MYSLYRMFAEKSDDPLWNLLAEWFKIGWIKCVITYITMAIELAVIWRYYDRFTSPEELVIVVILAWFMANLIGVISIYPDVKKLT